MIFITRNPFTNEFFISSYTLVYDLSIKSYRSKKNRVKRQNKKHTSKKQKANFDDVIKYLRNLREYERNLLESTFYK